MLRWFLVAGTAFIAGFLMGVFALAVSAINAWEDEKYGGEK